MSLNNQEDFSDIEDYSYENYYYFDNIDIFNLNHLHDIIDLSFDIHNIYSLTPYFLCDLNAQNLIDLFLFCDPNNNYHNSYIQKLYIYRNKTKIKSCSLDFFIKEFYNEIQLLLNIINKFLKPFKYQCTFDILSIYCYTYSNTDCLN
jgi:hypothetical protein